MTRNFADVPFGCLHRRLALGAAAGYVSDGYTLGVVGIAIAGANLQSAWMSGALGAGSLIGLFFGGLVGGVLADRCGRRLLFAYGMAACAALNMLQLVSPPTFALVTLRALLGVALGVDYVVCKALLIELVPKSSRGRILGGMGVAWAFGYALGYLAGYVLQAMHGDSWRWILASAAVPALVALPLRVTAPESPYWLTLKGRYRQAQHVIERVAGPGYAIVPEATISSDGRAPGIFSRTFLHCISVGSALYIALVIPYFAVGTFIPEVVSALHLSGEKFAGLLYNLSLTIGSLLGLLLVDRLPRRVFILSALALTTATLLSCIWFSKLQPLPVIVSFLLFSCSLSAAQTQIFVYLPELFHPAIRGSGVGLCVAISRIGAAVATFLLPASVREFGVEPPLYVCAGVLAAGGICCYLFAPETREDGRCTHNQPETTKSTSLRDRVCQ